MNVDQLRRETSEDHRAVEELLPLMHPSLNREEYVACLQRIYGIVAAWEERAEAHGPEWMRGMVIDRRRRNLLEQDLAWWGVEVDALERAELPDMEGDAAFLGCMYVMEGSTLGGQFIARHVERVLDLKAGEGVSFFRGHGDRTGAMWGEFCGVLSDRVPEIMAGEVIRAARCMFRAYGCQVKKSDV